MTLYEMNQAGYASLPKMAKSAIEGKKKQIVEWLEEIAKTFSDDQDVYFMLLNNNEQCHYYTLFAWREASAEALADEIFSIVKDLGTLKSIEKNDNGAWEFWVTLPNTSTHAYYLFDYTQGVIEV